MKLPRSSRSLWIATHEARTFPSLQSNLAVDVAVIGGGITGLSTALLLERAGLSVAVVEAGRVAEGVSGHTTAHITEVFDRGYEDLIEDFGLEGARLAVESGKAALARIEAFVREEAIACDLAKLSAYQFTEDPERVPDLEAERVAAVSLGVEASLTHTVPLPFTVAGALRFDRQAQLHPRRYLLALALAIPGGASHVFEHSRVVDIVDGDPCRVVTEQGTVTARHVVVATHAPLQSLLLQPKIAAYRSYVLALRMQPGAAAEAGLFWDTEDPYHYIRWQPTDEGPLLIVGGEDHKTGQESDTRARFEALAEYASHRFKVASVQHRWSAQVIEPADGLPYIGSDAGSPHVYVATGFSGTGMTLGTLAAMINSDLILGRRNPYQALYDPSRLKPRASIVEIVNENLDFPVQLVKDRLKGAEVTSVVEVGRGEGRIVDIEGEKTAVFRDERGLLHAVSAVCTHLGCLVGFNDAERTWDCPCHGSRFGKDGEILNGPAATPLASRADAAIVRDHTPPVRRRKAG